MVESHSQWQPSLEGLQELVTLFQQSITGTSAVQLQIYQVPQ
jgi:hypothetical protein